LDRRLGGPQSWSGYKRLEEKSFASPALSSERAPPKRTKTAIVFMKNKSGHESQKGLDTKTD
jgi:hypothetical protein